MDDSPLCPDCLEEHTVICSHCGQRIWASDNAGDSNRSLCQDCCDAYYLYCAQCGCLLSIDEAYIDDDNDYVCADCYHRAQNSQAIHNYNYKPAPIFYGTGDRYFGVELEIDRGGEDSAAARALPSIFRQRIIVISKTTAPAAPNTIPRLSMFHSGIRHMHMPMANKTTPIVPKTRAVKLLFFTIIASQKF